MGLDPGLLLTGGSEFVDIQRARTLADKSAGVFLQSYERELGGASTAVARREASNAALVKLERRLELQVVTENAEAWSRARDRSRVTSWDAHLVKMWDAWLDKKTCDVCFRLDGTIVPRNAQFKDPITRVPTCPGKIHPRCRCEEQILTLAEARRLGMRAAA